MRWSWKLGRVAGIDVRIHATFLILLVWIAAGAFLSGEGPLSVVGGILFLLAVFGIVVLHELGHALTARRFGIETRDITLLPIGGVSRLARMPTNPWQELLVAVSGPAVNVLLALLLLAYLLARNQARLLAEGLTASQGSWASHLFWINVSLAAFNLLPAFPMDGGRALRALLATRMDSVRATSIAARLGQGMALLLGACGLFLNPLLAFIALFVWMGASQEEAASQLRDAIEGIPVRSAMITELRTLAPEAPLAEAMRHVLEGFQQDFPVLRGGRLVGVLTRADLLRALKELGEATAVESAMRTKFVTAEASEMLSSALERLQSGDCPTAPVLDAGRLVGILTADNVGELVMFKSALRGRTAIV